MYTSKCKTELTIVEPEALPGAVCDSDDNLKCFCTEAGEKSDGEKNQSWILSHASKKWLKTRSNYKHAHSSKHAHVSGRLPHTPILNPAWLLSLEDVSVGYA